MKIKGNVCLAKRKNRDKSWTYYLRWHTERNGGGWTAHSERLFRSEPYAKHRSLREWERKAANAIAERQAEFDSLDEPEQIRKRERQVMALNEAIEHYSVWIRGDEFHAAPLAKSTADGRERHLLRFLNFMGNEFPEIRRMWQLSDRHTGHFREFRRAKGIRDATTAKECAHLQAFVNWCDDPIRGWMSMELHVLTQSQRKLLHTKPRQHRIPPDSTVKELVQGNDMLFCLAVTGLRQAELRALKVSDWSSRDRMLQVRFVGQEGSKRHERDLPVGDGLGSILESIASSRYSELPMFGGKDDMPLTAYDVHKRVKPFGYTSHDLRRWFYTKLLDMGCPLPYAMKFMGHTLPRQGSAYLPYTPEKGKDWMEKVEGILSIPGE